jgi:phenylacetate-CoA ligase
MSEMATDMERYPTLSEAGRDVMKFMREHPQAPIFRNQSGNRLTADDIVIVQKFERDIARQAVAWRCGGEPDWLKEFVEKTLADVPYYRSLGSVPATFNDIQPLCRADLAADIAQFVPDSVALDRLINFQTTGTTGNPMLIASHPIVAACYLGYHKKALQRFGIELHHGRAQVGVVLVGYQRRCFTYLSVTPTMGESGLAKINLHPGDWRDPADRAAYLDALAPEIYTGDPLSFAELLKLPLSHKPRALISVGMMLAAGMKATLEAHFNAPVLDIYSLNEAGPVAVYESELGGHLLLQPNLFVEILDENGRPVEPGVCGEITLSGGFNFCMPLLRYRTGDFASLSQSPAGPVLYNLSGRAPVRYLTESGDWINNIDITHALRPFAIAQFGFHQAQQGALTLWLAPSAMHLAAAARLALKPLFGAQPIQVSAIDREDKIIQYTSDLNGGVL